MKIKRFFAKDMRSALKEVKEELGVDAVIMSNKKLADGVEIVAAIDHVNTAAKPAQAASAPQAQPQAEPSIVRPRVHTHNQSEQKAKVADSLEALLQRQQPQPKNAALADMFSHSGIDIPPPPSAQAQQPSAPSQAQSLEDDLGDDIAQYAQSQFSTPANKQSQSQTQEMDAMRDEMSAIRELLEHQLSGLIKQEGARQNPTRACLAERLQGMGLAQDVAEHLVHYVPDDMSRRQAWELTLERLQKQLYTTNNEILRHGGVYALVGPTGVGKTTTVAKLAALGAQKYGASNVALITTDNYRIGAYEQLATYGRIIGCPIKQVNDAQELADTLYQLRDKRLVLIDTAGMSQRDVRLSEQLNTLMRNSSVDIRSYLVLSATAQREVLQESINHFQKVELSGCIFTKLDECLSLGEIISVAIQNRLPIGYLTNGQRVPEDIRVANPEKMIKKAEQLFVVRTKAQSNASAKPRSTLASESVGMYD